MKLFSTKNYKRNSYEGSTTKPLLVSVIPGKNWGYIIIKIGKLYYDCIQSHKGKRWCTLRCKSYAHGCRFKVKVRNISGVSEKENFDLFWRKECWQVVENVNAVHHCCTGSGRLSEPSSAITGLESDPASKLSIAVLPDLALSRIISYLSIEDIHQMRPVCFAMFQN